MKNKEKYIDFMVKCASDRDITFGIDKVTRKPRICGTYSDAIICQKCAFYGEGSCTSRKAKWLEEEFDEWSEFKDLKKGEIILVQRSGGLWFPVIFLEIDSSGLNYTDCVDRNGNCIGNVHGQANPGLVRKCIRMDYYEE